LVCGIWETAESSSVSREEEGTFEASKVTRIAGVRPKVVAVHVPVGSSDRSPADAEEAAGLGLPEVARVGESEAADAGSA